MKLPTQHAKRVGPLPNSAIMERDPGDYTGVHRLIDDEHSGQFYPGCGACMYFAKLPPKPWK